MVVAVAAVVAVVYFSSSLDRTRRPCRAVHDSSTGIRSKGNLTTLHTVHEYRSGNHYTSRSSCSVIALAYDTADYLGICWSV